MAGKKRKGKKKKGFPQAPNLPSGGAPNSPETSTESSPSFTTTQPSEAASPSATTTQQATDLSLQSPLSDCSPAAQSTLGDEASPASGGAQSLDEMKRKITESPLSPVEQGRLLVLLLSEKAQRDVMELSRATNPTNWMETMRAYIAASVAPSAPLGEEINTLKEKMSTLEGDVADAKVFKNLLADVFAYDGDAVSVATVPEFKRDLVAWYSRELSSKWGEPVIYCMMSRAYLPRKYVISSHLWKRAWHKHTKEMMGFPYIHDPRNGLLLFKPIERAFDTSQLCFISDDLGVCAWILNPDILEMRLVDCWLDQEREDGRVVPQSMIDTVTAEIGNMCFKDLHGWQLHSEVSSPRPFERVLHYQARMACRHAINQGWAKNRGLPQIPSIKSVGFSEERKDRLDRFFASLEAEGAAD